MLIHLVRKDFLIVKKYVLLMLAVCVFIPPFMMFWLADLWRLLFDFLDRDIVIPCSRWISH